MPGERRGMAQTRTTTPFDMSLVQRGARLRRSPFFEATQRYGPRGFTVYNHTLFPINFDDFEEEYWHLLNNVTLWDVAVERNVEISGPDGFRFAQLLTCRDLSKCGVGQAKYVLIMSPGGGIVNDPVMLRLDQNTFWFALADSDVYLYALGLAAQAGLDVLISEPEAYPVQVQGPRSKDLMADLFGEEVTSLRYYWFTRTELDGIPVIVTRTGWTSEVGYEVYLLDASKGVDLWERLMEAGRPGDRVAVHGERRAAQDQVRRDSAEDRGGRDRRRTTGHEPVEMAGGSRGKAGGEGHVGDLLPAIGEQHRVRVGARGALTGGHRAHGGDTGRRSRCLRRFHALRGSREADPEVLTTRVFPPLL